MASKSEIRTQIESELHRRTRLSVPAFAGGFLYLLSAIVITSTLNGLPTVGPLQGLAPLISGVANPPVSPRTEEVKFISRHAFPLIAGSVLAAVAIGALTLILLLLFDATAFRRPSIWRHARLLTLVGGISVGVASIAHEVVYAIETHDFATGHDFTRAAVDNALTKSAANQIVAYLSLLAGLALVVGMIVILLNSLRVGLVPRWLGLLGMFSGLLILLPNIGATLQLIPAFFMVMTGILLSGKWMGGDPPAWEAGEARPWPSRAQVAAERRGEPVAAAAGVGDVAPAPRPQQAGTSRKRRRKGGASRD
ncbi:MAG TPA: hypothetical protein VN618_14225 [Solirubrobacteraceae bacterium]|nr:hypothetical protein [Solirubrobacteraceae bacterium]